MDIKNVASYLALEPSQLIRAERFLEQGLGMFDRDEELTEAYLKEHLAGETLKYAMQLLDESTTSYMGVQIHNQGGKFSAPTAGVYGSGSRPELKKKIKEKILKRNERENKAAALKKEELELQEKKMSKAAHKKAAKAGKRWQDSDGDGKWYEPGEDVKKESVEVDEELQMKGKKKGNVVINPVVKTKVDEDADASKKMQIQRKQLMLNRQKVALQQKATTRKKSADMHLESTEDLQEVDVTTRSVQYGAEIEDTTMKPKKEKKSLKDFKKLSMGRTKSESVEEVEEVDESLKQARKNVGADKCWKGYKAKGTKMKDGRQVPNCVKEDEAIEEGKKGLWDNIHAKRKRGERPARPGEKDYPKTLNVEDKEEFEMDEATYPQDFKGGPVAKKKTGKPNAQGDYGKKDINEEDADRLRDRRMERGGVDGNTNYRKAPKPTNTAGKKKPYDGMSAMDKVKADIRAKYGHGAIMDTKKK
jgi:hypothetical protein|tara:strand:+ start:660 stop:2084 length:1425 start_codon:yes stop_codon:yes gene_type:complete